jgi:hypothetical protein
MLGIYCRTSCDNGSSISIIEQQKKEGIEFAFTQGFNYEIYVDKGISQYKVVE